MDRIVRPEPGQLRTMRDLDAAMSAARGLVETPDDPTVKGGKQRVRISEDLYNQMFRAASAAGVFSTEASDRDVQLRGPIRYYTSAEDAAADGGSTVSLNSVISDRNSIWFPGNNKRPKEFDLELTPNLGDVMTRAAYTNDSNFYEAKNAVGDLATLAKTNGLGYDTDATVEYNVSKEELAAAVQAFDTAKGGFYAANDVFFTAEYNYLKSARAERGQAEGPVPRGE